MVCECVYMQKRKGTLTYNFFAISASYATDDIGGGASEVISNLNDSFQRYELKDNFYHRARVRLKVPRL